MAGFKFRGAPIVEIQTQISEKLQVYRSANKQNFKRCVCIYIFCDFDVVSEGVQRKLFSERLFGLGNTDYTIHKIKNFKVIVIYCMLGQFL